MTIGSPAVPFPSDVFKAALAAHRQGDAATAARLYGDVIAATPNHAPSRFLLALILRAAGQPGPALDQVREAVRLEPTNPGYRQGLAEVLLAAGRTEKAERAFRMSLLCDPAAAPCLDWLGGRLDQTGDWRTAERLARWRRAIAEDRPALVAHAEILSRLGAIEAAWPLADRAIALGGVYDPLADLKSALMLPPIPESRDQILEARQRFSDSLERIANSRLHLRDPVSQIGRYPFYLAYHGLDDRLLAERFNAVLDAATPAFREDWRKPSGASGRTRIGVFSTFMNSHTVLRYTEGLIRCLSARADVETLAMPTHGLPVAAERHLAGLGAGVVPIPSDYGGAVGRIRDLALDIVIFADIGMEPLSGALAHTDLAARQIALSGHPVTTGIARLDGYVVCPAFEPAGFAAHYSEPVIPTAFWPLDFARPIEDPSMLPAPEPDHAGPVLLCAQSLFKIHPDMDAVFAELLDRLPAAVLEFVAPTDDRRTLADRFRRRLAGAGIDVERRVRFLPRMKLPVFLARLREADAVLDSWHFSGGASSFATLAVGTPVVTHDGAFYRGRQTAGMLRAAGITETIATSAEQFVAAAERLATERAFRRDLRRRVETGRDRLFNRRDGADALIDAIVGRPSTIDRNDTDDKASSQG